MKFVADSIDHLRRSRVVNGSAVEGAMPLQLVPVGLPHQNDVVEHASCEQRGMFIADKRQAVMSNDNDHGLISFHCLKLIGFRHYYLSFESARIAILLETKCCTWLRVIRSALREVQAL